MEVYPDSIRYDLPLRRYQIKWNEVRSIEIDSQGSSVVFVGKNKRLAVNGPIFWTGKEKCDAARLIAIQIDRYEIEVRATEKAMFRLSRNTRVGAEQCPGALRRRHHCRRKRDRNLAVGYFEQITQIIRINLCNLWIEKAKPGHYEGVNSFV